MHHDLQKEDSIVGNYPLVIALDAYGTSAQKELIEGIISKQAELAFGLTEPDHGSDATWLETTARREGDHWVINGRKPWNSRVALAANNLVFARTFGKPGDALGITAFIRSSLVMPGVWGSNWKSPIHSTPCSGRRRSSLPISCTTAPDI